MLQTGGKGGFRSALLHAGCSLLFYFVLILLFAKLIVDGFLPETAGEGSVLLAALLASGLGVLLGGRRALSRQMLAPALFYAVVLLLGLLLAPALSVGGALKLAAASLIGALFGKLLLGKGGHKTAKKRRAGRLRG